MATCTAFGSTYNTTAGNKSVVTAAPAVGDLFVVIVSGSGAAYDAASVTVSDNQTGGSYTLAVDGGSVGIFIRNNLVSTTSAHTITADMSTNTTTTGGGLQVIKVTGMSKAGSTANKQSAFTLGGAASTTPAPAFGASALTGNPTIGAVRNSTNPAGLTPPTNWTERYDVGYSTPVTGVEVITRNSGFTGTTITWGSTSASIYDVAILELDASSSGGTGDLTATLGAATVSSNSVLALQGTLSGTLGAATVSSNSILEIQATSSSTLGDVTLTSDAHFDLFGTLSATLSDASLSATAVIPLNGDLTATLDDVSISSDGSSVSGVVADLSATLENTTLVSNSVIPLNGTFSSTLDNVTLSSNGVVPLNATFSVSLGDATLSSNSALAVQATLSSTLDAVTLTSASGLVVVGNLTATLGTATLTAAAVVPITATLSSTLDAVTSSGSAALSIVGDTSVTLSDVTVASSGGIVLGGNTDLVLADVTLSADASLVTYYPPRTADLSKALEGVSLIFSSNILPPRPRQKTKRGVSRNDYKEFKYFDKQGNSYYWRQRR